MIGSTWQRVLEATYTDGVENAIKVYSDVMERTTQTLPMEYEKLLINHRRGVDKSMKTFNQAALLDSESELYQAYLDKLMVRCSNKYCYKTFINFTAHIFGVSNVGLGLPPVIKYILLAMKQSFI